MSEYHDDEKLPIAIPVEELKTMAAQVAEELRGAATPLGGELRERFINIRAALFQRGIFDPVLVRFDTISAPRASNEELAEQLATVSGAL